MNNRNTVLSFGFAALGTTLAAAALIYEKSAFSSFLLIAAMAPVFNTFCFLAWIGETGSIIRIAR